MIKAVVGANWGDEGKGKITDMANLHCIHFRLAYFITIQQVLSETVLH